jgi:hypothetical protein
MSIELYNAKNIGKKALYLADDAKHVGSFATNKKEYEKTLYNFLEKNNL